MDLITLEMLTTLAGCIAIVGILTQACKYIPKVRNISSLWVNFIISVIVGVLRMFVLKDFSVEGIILGILNIAVIIVSTSGTYEVLSHAKHGITKFGSKKKGE